MSSKGILGRAGWGLVDQMISSGTNAALSILVARSVGAEGFGGFSVAFIVFSLFVGLSKALCTSPLSMRFAGASPSAFRRAAASATGTALALGIVASVTCAAAGMLIGGSVGSALLALSLPLPGLLVQDAWRFSFFASARPAQAALNDALWAVLQLSLVWVLLARGVDQVEPFILAWGGAAVAAAVVGIKQAGVVPAPRSSRRWLREHSDLTRYLVAEFGTLQAFNQATMLIITAIATVEVVGALRGAQVLLGPAALFAISLNSFAMPEFARRRSGMTADGWLRGAMLLSFVVVAGGGVWGLICLLLPEAAGQELLGATWAGTHDVLLASVVAQAGAAMAIGPATVLYAMERASVTMRIHAAMAPLVVVGGVGGTLTAGAAGAAWGMAAAFWLVVPSWWTHARRQAAAAPARYAPARDVAEGGPEAAAPDRTRP